MVVSLIVLISTNTAYIHYIFSNRVHYQELSSGTCTTIITQDMKFSCPQASFLIQNDTIYQSTLNQLYAERNNSHENIDFINHSLLFVYVVLLNAGWNYQLIGLSQTPQFLQIHVIKQRIQDVTTQTILQYYHLLRIDKTDKMLKISITEQLQGVSWIAIASQFSTSLLLIVIIVQIVRDGIEKIKKKFD